MIISAAPWCHFDETWLSLHNLMRIILQWRQIVIHFATARVVKRAITRRGHQTTIRWRHSLPPLSRKDASAIVRYEGTPNRDPALLRMRARAARPSYDLVGDGARAPATAGPGTSRSGPSPNPDAASQGIMKRTKPLLEARIWVSLGGGDYARPRCGTAGPQTGVWVGRDLGRLCLGFGRQVVPPARTLARKPSLAESS